MKNVDLSKEKLISDVYEILRPTPNVFDNEAPRLIMTLFGSKMKNDESFIEFRRFFTEISTKKIEDMLIEILDDDGFWKTMEMKQRSSWIKLLIKRQKTENVYLKELTIIKNSVQNTNDVVEMFKDVDNSKNDVLDELKKLNNRLDKLETMKNQDQKPYTEARFW